MVGHFATAKAGHDKDTLYVIVAEEGDFVLLCDGRLKKLSHPKKKRKKHIQLIDRSVPEALVQDILAHTASDEQIKQVLQDKKREEMYVKK